MKLLLKRLSHPVWNMGPKISVGFFYNDEQMPRDNLRQGGYLTIKT